MSRAAKRRAGHRRSAEGRGWILVVLLVLMLIPWGLCGNAAGRASPGKESGSAVRPGAFFGTVVLGGFRALLIDYLWVRADILSRKKDYYELRATYDMLADLQPGAEEVWVFNGSNMVYDISAEYNTAAGRYAWIRAGLEFCVKGLEYNPDSEVIRMHLAEVFYFKFSYYSVQNSREFRRLLRREPDKSFLREPQRPSPARETLLYVEDVLRIRPSPQVHEFRIWAAHTLLWEQQVGLREARLEMLEARERYLLAPREEREQCAKVFKERQREYEHARRAPPHLTGAEADSLRARVNESLDAVLRWPTRYAVNVNALSTWEDDCRRVLKEIDKALDMYDQALDTLENSAGADPRRILNPEEVKTLEMQDMTDILPVNSLYVAPIYTEVMRRLKRFTPE